MAEIKLINKKIALIYYQNPRYKNNIINYGSGSVYLRNLERMMFIFIDMAMFKIIEYYFLLKTLATLWFKQTTQVSHSSQVRVFQHSMH